MTWPKFTFALLLTIAFIWFVLEMFRNSGKDRKP